MLSGIALLLSNVYSLLSLFLGIWLGREKSCSRKSLMIGLFLGVGVALILVNSRLEKDAEAELKKDIRGSLEEVVKSENAVLINKLRNLFQEPGLSKEELERRSLNAVSGSATLILKNLESHATGMVGNPPKK